MNITNFFASVRDSLFKGHLTQSQVDGLQDILDAISEAHITDHRWIAYMLATAFHETAQTMKPIEEYGKGKGHPYGRKIKRSGIAYSSPDKIYYGRGYIQLTWFENYQQMGRLLGIDLLNQPELALNPKHAADIMIEGMTKGNSHFGDFTGVSLENYFSDTKSDPVNARKIINGLDAADRIAGYYNNFLKALNS